MLYILTNGIPLPLKIARYLHHQLRRLVESSSSEVSMCHGLKLTHIFTVSLVLASLLSASIPSPTLAAPGDETTVGALSLYPAIENIGVVSSFSGDDNGNNSALLEYRRVGASQWSPGVPMSVDRRASMVTDAGSQTTNPYQNTWRASIFWLNTNTSYQVRITYSDPDGVTGTNPASETITTRNDNPPSSGSVFYVSTSGDNADPGTFQQPFRTIQHAASSVQAGDIVYIMPGTYNEGITINTSGSETDYITFQSYDLNNKATLSGGDYNFRLEGGDYVRIKGLDLRSPGVGNVWLDADYVIIEDCIMSGSSGNYWGGGVFVNESAGEIIQRNTITRSSTGGEPCGIFLLYTGGGHTIRDNTVTGPTGCFKDGIGGDINGMINGGPNNTTYIYNNNFEGCWDDGIEIEGGDVNIGVWGNVIHVSGGNMGIGLAPVLIGPVYVFRNVFTGFAEAAFKLGGESFGAGFLYHNTSYTEFNGAGPADFGHTPNSGNLAFRNNIYHVQRFVLADSGLGSTFDYDNGLIPPAGYNAWWDGYQAMSFPDFQSYSGQELNGISANSQFVSTANSNFRLQETSPCIDAGVILPSFNDQNSPWPYLGSSPDIGAYEYNSGGVTNQPPVLNAIGSKSVNESQLLNFTISATDPDGDQLTYSASNLPSGASFDTGTRTFSWTPATGQAGTYPNVHFEVSDGTLTDFENITITVSSGSNQPPVLNAIGNKSVNESQLLEFTISATDPNGDQLTYSASNLPSGASFDTGTRTFSWTPATGQAGTYPNVHFEVSDGTLTDSENITITVTVNAPPSLPLRVNAAGDAYNDSLGNSWQADQAYVTGSWGFNGNDNTEDLGTGYAISGTVDDRIYQTERWGLSGYRFDLGNGTYNINLHFAETYSGITGPGQRVFDVSIEGQLVLDDLDIFSEVGHSTALKKTISGIIVQDGQISIDFVSSIENPKINGIEIISAGPNQPPVLNPIGNKSVNEGQLLEFTISAADPNGDPLTYSASNLPSGASFDTDTRAFSWTPTTGQAGTYPDVHLEVSDGTFTDSEGIDITVNKAPPIGGGGGGAGSRDTIPPRFSDIIASDITRTSASIYWTTQEKSNSQVEYRASQSTFSPLDETMDLNHVVQLTDLTPFTTYYYKVMSHDVAGNLAVSDEYTFTTLGSSATFAVSALDITPTEVYAGETVLVNVQVTNRGDTAGNYEVVFKIDEVVVATKDITNLAGGATQDVSFNAARDTAGIFTVDVNGITASFVVKEALATKISLFSVNPSYNSDTGQFACARVTYEVDNPSESLADVRLVLKVSLDGEPAEEVSLFSTNQLELGRTGSLDYIPPQGWESGTYTFKAELYVNGELYASTIEENLEVTAESAVAVVSWATLGGIIGIMLIVIAATVVVILRRKRDMLGA